MSKDKITIVDSLYQMSFPPGTRKVYQLVSNNAPTLRKLADKSNIELNLCFNDKKDKRRDKSYYYPKLEFDINSFLSNFNPNCDFVFSQCPTSEILFHNIIVGGIGPNNGPNYIEKPDINNTLTWNAPLKKIEIHNCPFKNININFTKYLIKDALKICPIIFITNSPNLKTFKINNVLQELEIRNLNCKNLEVLDLSNNNNVYIDTDSYYFKNSLNLQKLKYVDFSNCNVISLDLDSLTSPFEFFSKELTLSKSNSNEAFDYYSNLFKHINPNVKFVFTKNTKIAASIFNNFDRYDLSKGEKNGIEINKILDFKGKDKLEITPIDLINLYSNKVQEKILLQLDSYKKQISKLTSKSANQSIDEYKKVSR